MNRIVCLVFVIGSLAALACNAPVSAIMTATPTATATAALTDTPLPTETPAATSTSRPVRPETSPTPTLTPTPELPSLDEVTLQLGDLPNGYNRFDEDALDELHNEVDGKYFYDVQNTFGFGVGLENGAELIFGFAVIFPTDDPFGDAVDPSDQVDRGLRDMTDFIGGRTLLDEGEFTDFGRLGDAAVGYYADAETESQQFRIEVIAFHRGIAGVYLYQVYPLGASPSTPTADLAFILDARLEESLKQ